MKTMRILFTCFLAIQGAALSAQVASFTLPDFSADQVVMKVTSSGIRTSFITLTDGSTSYTIDVDNQVYTAKSEKTNNSLNTLAMVINKMSEKKYEILTATAVSYGDFIFTTYIFKKD